MMAHATAPPPPPPPPPVDGRVHACVSCSYCCCHAFSFAGRGDSWDARGTPRGVPGIAPRPDLNPSALVPAGTLSGGHFTGIVTDSTRLPQASRYAAGPAGGQARLPARAAKRFFHGSSGRSTRARGFPIKSGRSCHSHARHSAEAGDRVRLPSVRIPAPRRRLESAAEAARGTSRR